MNASIRLLTVLFTLFMPVLLKAGLPDVKAGDPDHHVFIELESKPNGVEIFTIPDAEGNQVFFKKTRCTIPVELRWKTKYGRQSWVDLQVSSPNSMVTAQYDADAETFVFTLTFEARKPGYKNMTYTKKALVLKKNMINWVYASQFPTKRVVKFEMEKAVSSGGSARKGPPKVIVASSSEEFGDIPGNLVLTSKPSNATVTVNGVAIAQTPVELVLLSGLHKVQVDAPGYTPWRRKVRIEPRRHVGLEAVLEEKE